MAGSGQSKPEVPEGESNEVLLERAKAQTGIEKEKLRSKESEIKTMEKVHKEMLKAMKEAGGGSRADTLRADKLQAQLAEITATRAADRENLAKYESLLKMAETNADAAKQEASVWQAQAAELEKDRQDWKKAEEEKADKLMKESPPPFVLMKNPPHNSPLYTHDYPCFAVVGKAGTGKSSLINAICGKTVCTVGALTETTMGEPPPVFTQLPNGRQVGFFDRPGVGAKAMKEAGDSKVEFIKKIGLRWWTGVIVVIERSAVAEEVMMYAICKELKIPIVVARNKIELSLKDEEEAQAMESPEPFDRNKAMATIQNYVQDLGVSKEDLKLIDTKFPANHQYGELLGWLQQLSCTSSSQASTGTGGYPSA